MVSYSAIDATPLISWVFALSTWKGIILFTLVFDVGWSHFFCFSDVCCSLELVFNAVGDALNKNFVVFTLWVTDIVYSALFSVSKSKYTFGMSIKFEIHAYRTDEKWVFSLATRSSILPRDRLPWHETSLEVQNKIENYSALENIHLIDFSHTHTHTNRNDVPISNRL